LFKYTHVLFRFKHSGPKHLITNKYHTLTMHVYLQSQSNQLLMLCLIMILQFRNSLSSISDSNDNAD